MPEVARLTLPAWVRELAATHAGRDAVVGSHRRITYTELEAESRRVARGLLARGIGRGSRVGLLLGNGPDWVVTFLAVARLGAVAVPLSTFYRGRELGRVVRHADLRGLVLHRAFLDDDVLGRLAGALPDLADVTTIEGELVLRSAPFLRWVVALEADEADVADAAGDGVLPAWARPRSWLHEAAGTGPFDDAVLAAVEDEVHPGDDAIMIYTSGSTADAKGVPHTHEVVLRKTHHLVGALGIVPGTRSFIASPFFWVGGLTMSLLPVLDAGGTQYCLDRFTPEAFLDLVAHERLERAVLYPHHIESLLAAPGFGQADRSSLRDAHPAILAPGTPPFALPDGLVSGLGMTETFAGYWWGRPLPAPTRPLLPGERRTPPLDRLLPGMELKVVTPEGEPVADGGRGELCLRGWSVTRGLHKVDRASLFDADGWFHTGDEVEVDGARLHFRGRLGDMIKTAGANVSPAEVADVLQAHPSVAEAHVVGLDDPMRGQLVAAAVVAAAGHVVDVEQLRAHVRTELSTYKVPAHVVVLDADEVPWTASHKVRRGALAELVAARLTSTADASS